MTSSSVGGVNAFLCLWGSGFDLGLDLDSGLGLDWDSGLGLDSGGELRRVAASCQDRHLAAVLDILPLNPESFDADAT